MEGLILLANILRRSEQRNIELFRPLKWVCPHSAIARLESCLSSSWEPP